MTTIVLVHGAFRGGWAWDRVVPLLTAHGHTVVAPTLRGCEPHSPLAGTAIALSDWVQDVTDAVGDATDVLLVGHSQGGIVTTAAAQVLADRTVSVLHLDAPVPLEGQRGIDLNPPGVPAPPPGLDPATWIPARPVGAEQGFDDVELAAFVNTRLVPTPLGPSLDPVHRAEHAVRERFVFCTQTPTTYPCWGTRLRLDADGTPYTLIESAHDAPLLASQAVADVILETAASW